MSNYNTGNPKPSIDPRDLDDNATNFDLLLLSTEPSVPDRLGIPRKTWWQMEQDAMALVSPNVAALAGLAGVADRVPYFTGVGALSLATLTSLARTFTAAADAAAQAAALPWVAPKASPALSGVPTAPTADPGTATTQIATTSFVGTAGSLKAPLASPTFTGTPAAPTPAVGTNTTQLATAAMVQAEIANKRTWTSYTPTLTAASGSYTTVSAAGRYMVMFGICFVQITCTFTARGGGTLPIIGLPVAALAGSGGMALLAQRTTGIAATGAGRIQAADHTKLTLVAADGSGLDNADGAIVTVSGSFPIA